MSEQKFHAGDLVQIAKDLGRAMSHFTGDCRAIVVGSYKDQYGGGSDGRHCYTLWLEGRGTSSWYDEWQLTLIETGQHALMEKWKADRDARDAQHSDINWIFANGADVLAAPDGAALETLGEHLGIDNLWGSHGEGMSYYANAMAIMSVASPYLVKGDKDGFIAYSSTHKLRTADYRIG